MRLRARIRPILYEIFKAKSAGDKIPADKKAIATLKPEGKVVLKAKKAGESDVLIIRIAGDKRQTLPSPFASNTFKAVYLETPKAAESESK